jgi:RNA polymerase sigma factor (sigma-70 family)
VKSGCPIAVDLRTCVSSAGNNELKLGGDSINYVNTDAEVIRRSREAPAEFGELFVRHAGVLHRYVARRVGINAADDVLSDTFLIAFERRDRFDPAWMDARPWLYGIATNLIRKYHHDEARALKALMAAPREISPTDEDIAVGRRVDAERSFATLSRTLRRMPARDRDTLLLFAWAELSYEEIAVATNTPVGTVRSRLNRAKRTLRDATSITGAIAPQQEVPQWTS